MSAAPFPPIPEETAEAALSVFGSGNTYLVIGKQADALFQGIHLQQSTPLSPKQHYRLAMLYLSTIFQHMETLPDRLAVGALRERLDWKYALHASLNPIPIEASTLCEFRKKVSCDPLGKQNFQALLDRMAEIPQIALYPCSRQNADGVIRHVCLISRLANVWAAINNTLQALAIMDPAWLRDNSLPYWYERYSHSHSSLNLMADQPDLEAFAQALGKDGFYLLETINRSGGQILGDLPEARELRQVWDEQFDQEMGNVIWRKEACAGCALPGLTQSII